MWCLPPPADTASTACFDPNGLRTNLQESSRNEPMNDAGGACDYVMPYRLSLNTLADGVISNQDVDAEEYVTRGRHRPGVRRGSR